MFCRVLLSLCRIWYKKCRIWYKKSFFQLILPDTTKHQYIVIIQLFMPTVLKRRYKLPCPLCRSNIQFFFTVWISIYHGPTIHSQGHQSLQSIIPHSTPAMHCFHQSLFIKKSIIRFTQHIPDCRILLKFPCWINTFKFISSTKIFRHFSNLICKIFFFTL